MAELVRNRVDPLDLTEAGVEAALARIAGRDVELARGAAHVYESLTWGEGPAQLRLAGVQEWLWYRVPTKYLTDEVGYMGRLAAEAAALFDELGLDAYAALCRGETTARVHAAYQRSDGEGRRAMRKAMTASGIEPPDLDDFAWGDVMGVEEAMARTAVEDALERAMANGELTVGARGWRGRQRAVTARTLDGDHPSQPGQSWRSAVITERIGTWVDHASRRSEVLGPMRARVANRLLHPVGPPGDVEERMAPVVWLLDVFGDEQPLTQAGYLARAFVSMVHDEAPWEDPFRSDRSPRSETDEVVLHRLRGWLQHAGALRRRGRTLHRTRRGAAMAHDAATAWEVLVCTVGGHPWDRFVVETAGLVLVDRGGEMPRDELIEAVGGGAHEMGWRTVVEGAHQPPSDRDVAAALYPGWALLELFGFVEEHGGWRDRRFALSPAGEPTILAVLRETAAGPRKDL